MGECLDQLHVQCVILGEILLGTLDRVREELINDGELRLYQGAAMETGRRQVVEYLITMYYRYKAQKLLVQKAPSDSVEIKVEANDGWQTHQGEEQEKVIEGTSILKPSPKKKPVRKRGRPSATVSKATISINNINNSYEVDNRDEPQTKTKRISEEFAVTSETVDTKWLNCYVNLEPSVASDNNKVNNEPKSESDDHITDAGDNMDDISSDEEGHPDDHIKDADYNPSGNTPVKVCSTLFSPQRSSTEVTHQPAVTQPRKTQVKKTYRQKLKETDPKKYEAYLIEQKQRNKIYRQNIKQLKEKEEALTEKEKLLLEKYDTCARRKQKKFRERQKQQQVKSNGDFMTENKDGKIIIKREKKVSRTKKRLGETVVSDLDESDKREYWRQAKSKWRKSLSESKKQLIKEQDRKRKQNDRNLQQSFNNTEPSIVHSFDNFSSENSDNNLQVYSDNFVQSTDDSFGVENSAEEQVKNFHYTAECHETSFNFVVKIEPSYSDD